MSVQDGEVIVGKPTAVDSCIQRDLEVLEYIRGMLQSLLKINSNRPILSHLLFLTISETEHLIGQERRRTKADLDVEFRDA